jgi:hypothetical protein
MDPEPLDTRIMLVVIRLESSQHRQIALANVA